MCLITSISRIKLKIIVFYITIKAQYMGCKLLNYKLKKNFKLNVFQYF